MKITIGRKLGGSFFVLGLLVLVTAVVGITMNGKVASSNEVILEEAAPIKDVAMEATISLERGISTSREYVLAHDDLDAIEADLDEAIEDFDMFLAMVELGTESGEFRNSPAGKMYVKDGLTLNVPRGNDEMLDIITLTRSIQQTYNERLTELKEIHPQKAEHHFTFEDNTYTLSYFLNKTSAQHAAWVKQLEEAVEYGVEFKGQLDPTKCDFGVWASTYKTNDTEISEALVAYMVEHTKLHEVGRATVTADEDLQASMLSKVTRQANKVERVANKLQVLTEAKFQDLATRELACIATVSGASESMTAALEHLEEVADAAMAEAQESAKNAASNAFIVMLTLATIAAVLAIAVGVIITRGIVKPLSKVVSATERMNAEFEELEVAIEAIANNDLTNEVRQSEIESLDIRSRDEIGILGTTIEASLEAKGRIANSMAKMVTNLTGIIRQIGENSTQLVSAANEVAS